METLYPLKFETIFKEKIWGGQKINTVLGKSFEPLENCGETWEVSGVEGNVSVVKEGPLKGRDLQSLVKEYQGKLVGNRVYEEHGDEFPLLVKFIDANKDLSIQVHPDDKLAQARHGCNGKTEMWYVFQADHGSKLISGFNKPVTKEEYLRKLKDGSLMEILNEEEVKPGDAFFLPAGRVHTIGKGLLLAEIQQSSDVTYRIYDFDRKDKHGNKRELHTDQAMDAIDYNFYDEYKSRYEDQKNMVIPLVKCNYFNTNKLWFNETVIRDYTDVDSFIIQICFAGGYNLEVDGYTISVHAGDAVLIPASANHFKLQPHAEYQLLETFVPPKVLNE